MVLGHDGTEEDGIYYHVKARTHPNPKPTRSTLVAQPSSGVRTLSHAVALTRALAACRYNPPARSCVSSSPSSCSAARSSWLGFGVRVRVRVRVGVRV